MQSPPFPRYLFLTRSKYSLQHHVLKHPQLPFLPQCQRPNNIYVTMPCVKCHHLRFFIFGLVICQKWRRPSPANSFLFRVDEFWSGSLLLTNYFSGNKSRRIRWTGHMARMEEWIGAYSVFLDKSRRKRQFGRAGSRWRTTFIWRRTGRGGGPSLMRWYNSDFHKMWDVSWLAEDMLASRE